MQTDAHSEDPNDASETVGRRLRDRHFFSGSINDIGEKRAPQKRGSMPLARPQGRPGIS
jgi:hypothetical protein